MRTQLSISAGSHAEVGQLHARPSAKLEAAGQGLPAAAMSPNARLKRRVKEGSAELWSMICLITPTRNPCTKTFCSQARMAAIQTGSSVRHACHCAGLRQWPACQRPETSHSSALWTEMCAASSKDSRQVRIAGICTVQTYALHILSGEESMQAVLVAPAALTAPLPLESTTPACKGASWQAGQGAVPTSLSAGTGCSWLAAQCSAAGR